RAALPGRALGDGGAAAGVDRALPGRGVERLGNLPGQGALLLASPGTGLLPRPAAAGARRLPRARPALHRLRRPPSRRRRTHLWGLDLQDFPLGVGAKIARWHELEADGVFDHWGAYNETVPSNSVACREFFLNPLADPETVCRHRRILRTACARTPRGRRAERPVRHGVPLQDRTIGKRTERRLTATQ
ncbi:MAG: hypothetical protein K9N51_09395, partial [Candidatus Pacebacteria bacterium]|nr:hypothetical protein [Candidatus Paceibacterota bacterium]